MNMDDALDEQIEMLRRMIRSSRPHSGSEEAHDAWDDAIDKAYAVLDTVRAELEQLREERDEAYQDAQTAEHRASIVFQSERDEMQRLVRAAEAEVQRLTDENTALAKERSAAVDAANHWHYRVRRLTEGLREIEQTPLGRNRLTDGEIIVAIRAKARAALSASPSDGGGAK